MGMRGIHTSINDIRRKVFSEVARLSYHYDGDLSDMENIPYRIIPGEVSTYRESVFLERAIVKERMRLAMGLPLRDVSEHAPVSQGAEECVSPEKYYQPPLINIIKFACHKCPDNVVAITDQCQGCLAQPCRQVCPRDAIFFERGQCHIDQSKCIKCGKCMGVCQYGAILRMERPCAVACGMKAIKSDAYGRAEIDQEKCVSCGMCLANCPFGAIADKAQIFQCIQAIRSDTPVYAAIAPAIAGQFGKELPPEKMRAAFLALGFTDMVEVAIGADLCTMQEARDFLKEVPEKLPFMGTSCCPAWSVMAKREFPQRADCISMALTPMVLTGRLLKKQHPGCKVAFIGPCAAKKLEASRRTVRSEVDFVLTFEELWGMLEAKGIDPAQIEDAPAVYEASAPGVGFAAVGGVAGAVAEVIHRTDPDREVKTAFGDGLRECRKMLRIARSGKYDGYLLEGMACPGGCIAGAGTVQPPEKSKLRLEQYKARAALSNPLESAYMDDIELLHEDPDGWGMSTRH